MIGGASGPGRSVVQRAGAPAPPGPVYAIADVGVLGERARPSVPDAVAAMARAGCGWIQLRAKGVPDRTLYHLALACQEAVEETGSFLWIDDRPDVAVLCRAAGVHLGQEDLPAAAARQVAGSDLWIGRSTHDADQVLAADRDPAVDVIAVGPVFQTGTKENPDPVVGLEMVRRARTLTAKPLVAVGGIDHTNIGAVLAAGADAAAVISAVCRGDVEENVRCLAEAAELGAAARR